MCAANTIHLGRNFLRRCGQSYRGAYSRIYESKRIYEFLIYSSSRNETIDLNAEVRVAKIEKFICGRNSFTFLATDWVN